MPTFREKLDKILREPEESTSKESWQPTPIYMLYDFETNCYIEHIKPDREWLPLSKENWQPTPIIYIQKGPEQ
jgi:hypothetical protein